MKNHNRLYNLLAAGSLTALLLLTFLLFRGNGFDTAVSAAANQLTGTTASVANTERALDLALNSEQEISATQANTASSSALPTLQAQNTKLIQMLQVMQERERQYQSQLNAASQALQATQAQPSAEQFAGEHGEHERDEHEEHEGFGEHGDDD